MARGDLLKVFLDMLSAFAIVYFLTDSNPILYLSGVAAIIPDGLTLLHIIFPHNRLLTKHRNYHIQFNEIGEKIKDSCFCGFLTQLSTAALAIYFLI